MLFHVFTLGLRQFILDEQADLVGSQARIFRSLQFPFLARNCRANLARVRCMNCSMAWRELIFRPMTRAISSEEKP